MSNFKQNSEILKHYEMHLLEADFNANSKKKVIVGMSGGVDSSVAALILKWQGFDVYGMFMKNWEEVTEDGSCTSEVDYLDVIRVCEEIDIPYYSVNFANEYKSNVFDSFVEELKLGHTPNPDILCNREIKFKVFFNHAMELEADFLATGHYCQKKYIDGNPCLVKGHDTNKDQTYFLYTIQGKVLDRVLFPIGDINKPVVRQIAKDYKLATHAKKDSTGICFIGERNFKSFISNYIKSTKGNFVDLDANILGPHDGHPFYTVGQRKGLGIGGPGAPWFVVAKDVLKNEVILAQGEQHPALFSHSLVATDISWVNELNLKLPYKCKSKVRYRQPDQDCVITKIEGDVITVEFPDAQRAITQKQSVVFYADDICLGGAIINDVGESLYVKSRD
jgi:tRNA-uridine 2-sulfurtransferase